MRRALELFSIFLTSGNTKIRDEILPIYRYGDSKIYQIAYHQFVKAIVLGTNRYYSEQKSYLMNMFNFNPEYSHSHFLNLKILNYAQNHLMDDSPYGRGYVSINRLREEAKSILIPVEAIDESLRKLAERGLITLNTRSRETLENASHFMITDCGSYYLEVLIFRFVYLDLVLADTPIADIDLVSKLRSVLHCRDLEDRFSRTEMFIEYLITSEEREFQLNPEYVTSELGRYRFAGRIRKAFLTERKYIEGKIASKIYSPVY